MKMEKTYYSNSNIILSEEQSDGYDVWGFQVADFGAIWWFENGHLSGCYWTTKDTTRAIEIARNRISRAAKWKDMGFLSKLMRLFDRRGYITNY